MYTKCVCVYILYALILLLIIIIIIVLLLLLECDAWSMHPEASNIKDSKDVLYICIVNAY